MGEVGCLKDGHFQNLQVKGNVNSLGTMNIGGGGVIFGGGIGVIPSTNYTTITAALMLDNSVLDHEGPYTVGNAAWDTGANIEAALIARGVVPQNGMSFDVYINNADNSWMIWAALAAGITSGSGAATANNCQIPVATAGLSGSGHFRFVRTGADAYTVFNLGMAAS